MEGNFSYLGLSDQCCCLSRQESLREMQACMEQRWANQEILVRHDEFELLIRHPNGDVIQACRHMSLELGRHVGQRQKFGSHQYVVVSKTKEQNEIIEGESVLGNPLCVSHDGKQGLPSTEEIESARLSLSLTPGSCVQACDLGSANLGLLSRILNLEPKLQRSKRQFQIHSDGSSCTIQVVIDSGQL